MLDGRSINSQSRFPIKLPTAVLYTGDWTVIGLLWHCISSLTILMGYVLTHRNAYRKRWTNLPRAGVIMSILLSVMSLDLVLDATSWLLPNVADNIQHINERSWASDWASQKIITTTRLLGRHVQDFPEQTHLTVVDFTQQYHQKQRVCEGES